MRDRYNVKFVEISTGEVTYLAIGKRMEWTKAKAEFLANSTTIRNKWKGYTISVEKV